MKYLKNIFIACLTVPLLCLFSVSIFASTRKTPVPHNFKIVTMQPIVDNSEIDSEIDNDTDVNINRGINIDSLGYINKDLNIEQKSNEILKNTKTSAKELKCLTQIIYFEAKSEGYNGGVAVGNVVMNRVNSDKFPDTICAVMNQKYNNMCQFSFVCNGQINQKLHNRQWQQSQKIALDILNGTAPKLSNGALFFHAKYAKLRLPETRYTAKIGHHYFYK